MCWYYTQHSAVSVQSIGVVLLVLALQQSGLVCHGLARSNYNYNIYLVQVVYFNCTAEYAGMLASAAA